MGVNMENENNAGADANANVNANGADQNTGADNGSANATATAENEQTQSTDAGNGQGDQGATSQDNSNSSSGNANQDVDYSTLVPTISIEHDPNSVPDPVKDPAGYAKFINDDAETRAKFRNTEINGWKQLEQEFPEIKTNDQLRQNILARRIYDAQNGNDKGLVEAGRAIMSPVNQAHSAGKTDAQVGIEEQQRGGVNRATGQHQRSSNDEALITRFRRGDQEAGRSLVEQMLKDKRI